MTETITINFDGGSRGNPGPAGIGVVLSAQDGTPLVTLGKYVGVATNNVAEYMALLLGLREAARLGAQKIVVRGDSELVIKQMKGQYRVKNPQLKQLYEQACAILDQFKSASFEHNLRHHNSMADRLANRAMDRKGDVEDAEDSVTSAVSGAPGEASDKSNGHFSCSNCGCEIQVTRPPRKPTGNAFICQCGKTME
jgi:ribonuclease HI